MTQIPSWLAKIFLSLITAAVVIIAGCDSSPPPAIDMPTTNPDPGDGNSLYGFWNDDSEFFPGEVAVVYSGSEYPLTTNTSILIDGVELGSNLPVAGDGSVTFIVPPLVNGIHKLNFQIAGDSHEFDFNVSSRSFTADMELSIIEEVESDINSLFDFTHENNDINFEVENAIFNSRSAISSISMLSPEQKAYVYSYIQSLKALTLLESSNFHGRAIFDSTLCGKAADSLSRARLKAARAGFAIAAGSVVIAANPVVGGLLAGSGFLALYSALDSIKKSYSVLVDECSGPVSIDLNVNNNYSDKSSNRSPFARAASNYSFVDGDEYTFEVDSNYEYDERITQTIGQVNALLTRLSSFIPESTLSFFDAGLPDPEGETNYSDFQISAISNSSIQVSTSAELSSLGVTFSTTMEDIPENGIPFSFDFVKTGHPDLTVNYRATLESKGCFSIIKINGKTKSDYDCPSMSITDNDSLLIAIQKDATNRLFLWAGRVYKGPGTYSLLRWPSYVQGGTDYAGTTGIARIVDSGTWYSTGDLSDYVGGAVYGGTVTITSDDRDSIEGYFSFDAAYHKGSYHVDGPDGFPVSHIDVLGTRRVRGDFRGPTN